MTLALTGMFSSTHAKKFDAMLGSTVGGSFVYGPESTVAGRRKFTGASVMTSLKYDAPVNGKVVMDANFLVTLNNASPITLTIPLNATVAFPIGTPVYLCRLGAGSVTVAIYYIPPA